MNDISCMQQIRQRIQQQYRENPNVHVNVSLAHPRLRLKNVEATIIGAYAHIFQLEENQTGQKRRHTLQYADVLLHHIDILDMQ